MRPPPPSARFPLQMGDGYTALHLAAQEGHLDVAKVLLEHHANPNLPTDVGAVGQWAAHQCLRVAATPRVCVLHRRRPLQTGDTALHCAVRAAHPTMVKLLLEADADVAVQDDVGLYPRARSLPCRTNHAPPPIGRKHAARRGQRHSHGNALRTPSNPDIAAGPVSGLHGAEAVQPRGRGCCSCSCSCFF
jgi:ankyrin repeat protein